MSVMDSNNKLELINIAIQRLMEEKKTRGASGDSLADDDVNDQLLLSRLLSQLESLKGDGAALKELEAPTEVEEISSAAHGHDVDVRMENAGEIDVGGTEIRAEEIVKELKEVKRQNFVTHCLVSVMIVLTVAWQVSEVSLVLKVKDGLSHPFRSFRSILVGMLKGPDKNGQDAENQSSPAKPLLVDIPEVPFVDLGSLSLDGEKN